MAGSKKSVFQNSMLKLILQNVAIANIGDAGGLQPSATAGALYVALYNTAPTNSTQGTETTYDNYTRMSINRGTGAGGWFVNNNLGVNVSSVVFPTCGATGDTIVAFSINTGGTTGVDDAIYWGDIDTNLVVTTGVAPTFNAGDSNTGVRVYES
jgi:hypothetical protein